MKKSFLLGLFSIVLVFGIMMLSGCDLDKKCADTEDCNDNSNWYYCGKSGCNAKYRGYSCDCD